MNFIEATYIVDEATLKPAMSHLKSGNSGIRVLNVFVLIFLLASASQVVWFSKEHWYLLLLAVALFVSFLYLRINIIRLAIKNLKKSPQYGYPAVFTFTPNYLTVNLPGSDGEFDYRFFAKCVEKEDGLLLYHDNSQATWIPHSAFKSDEERRAALDWLTAARVSPSNEEDKTVAPAFSGGGLPAIHASYIWNFQSALPAMVIYMRHQSKVGLGAKAMGLLLLSMSVPNFITSGISAMFIFLTCIAIFLLLSSELFGLFLAVFVLWSPVKGQLIEAKFTNLGYHIGRKGVHSEGVYEAVQETVTAKAGFLFVFQSGSFTWIPRRSIREPDGYERLAMWLGQKSNNKVMR